MKTADVLWSDVGRLWLSVALGEVSARDGVHELLVAVERTLAVGCAIEDSLGRIAQTSSGAPTGTPTTSPLAMTSFVLQDARRRPMGRLVFFGVVEAAIGERLSRIVARLLDIDPSLGLAGRVRHGVNNALSVLLVNLELIESLVEDGPPAASLIRGPEDDRAVVLQAFAQALESARSLTQLMTGTTPEKPE